MHSNVLLDRSVLVGDPEAGVSFFEAELRLAMDRARSDGSLSVRLPSYQELSKEQDRINDLPADGRHLVIGPPGTGKTVMALYRASMLKKRRRKAMLLMYSRLLMQYTENAAGDLLLDGQVATFHSWFSDFYRRNYQMTPPETAPLRLRLRPRSCAWVNANPPKPEILTDLLVDEGQDLQKEFYMLTPIDRAERDGVCR